MKKFSLAFLSMIVLVSTFFASISFAATIGNQLTTPEEGWKRVDGGSAYITKIGTWTTANHVNYYNGIDHYTITQGSSFTFSFIGTAFRLIDQRSSNRTVNSTFVVDGVSETVNLSLVNDANQTVVYEKLGLTYGRHKVTITKNDATNANALLSVDAVDIIGDFTVDVGSQLTTPEAGWQRYDDEHPGFKYNGIWRVDAASPSATTSPYLDRQHWVYFGDSNGLNNSVEFNFVGTSLRIITSKGYNDSSNIGVTIDGTKYQYNPKNDSMVYQVLLFEIKDLPYGVHTVRVQPTVSGQLAWDAIDIDASGYLISPNITAPNLTANAGTENIVLNWNSVGGATGYNVKRSLTAGGPYETIASGVTDSSYMDTDVSTGITYYYVVTAVNANGESSPSNEASATITVPSNPDRALLTIYISGGQIKEYDLSAADLSTFLNWYDTKDAGSGPAKYAFAKTWNKGPFKTRTEYVIFDKILTFDVDEYEVENP